MAGNCDTICTGIRSVVFNDDGTMTVTLTDGSSYTSPDLIGPVGPQGPTGPTGPTGPAGTPGTNGIVILANQYPNLATLGTSYESLLEGRTPYVLPANTLATNLDEITIHAVFTTNSVVSSAAKFVRLLFNGNTLNTNSFEFGLGSQIAQIQIDARISRITNSTAKVEFKVTRFIGGYATGVQFYSDYVQNIVSLAGLDFTGNPYNIDAQGDSSTIGDITCTVFEVLNYKI